MPPGLKKIKGETLKNNVRTHTEEKEICNQLVYKKITKPEDQLGKLQSGTDAGEELLKQRRMLGQYRPGSERTEKRKMDNLEDEVERVFQVQKHATLRKRKVRRDLNKVQKDASSHMSLATEQVWQKRFCY